MTDLSDAELRERLIQTFFAAFRTDALGLVQQKALSRELTALVSSFARIAADRAIRICDAAQREQAERDAKLAENGAGCRLVDHMQRFCACFEIAAAIRAGAGKERGDG